MKYIIEIATTDFPTTKNAVEGGADRIELCAALHEGGTTPSAGLIRLCRESFQADIFPIIRPRGGDFLYTDEEFNVMITDIRLARSLGCNGIVTGALSADGTIQFDQIRQMVDLAYPMEVNFHRAFDRCRDPFEALEQIIDAGCQRILTSGQQPTALEGKELIASLVEKADGRITIMPGSGVRKENIREIAEQTGTREFHSSLRTSKASAMKFLHPSFESLPGNYYNPHILPGDVSDLRKALEN